GESAGWSPYTNHAPLRLTRPPIGRRKDAIAILEASVMCSRLLVALCGLLVAQGAGAAPATSAPGATQPSRQVEKVARVGERELALTIDFGEALGGRHEECPSGLAPSGCWLF